MRLELVLALATTGLSGPILGPDFLDLPGPGDRCDGWDYCQPGLMCRDAGIPRAGNTCQYAQLGEECHFLDAHCEEGLQCLPSDSFELQAGTYTCVYLAGLGETCGGWDESTGEPFPDCQEGLMCRDAGLMSIPGAGNTCQNAQLGEVCQSWNEDTGSYFASCEEGLECRLTDSQGEELTCVYLAGLGETCGGWDESTGEPLSVLCEDGLMCRDAGLMSIPGAGNTCQYAQLGEPCQSWNEDTGSYFASCEEGLECRRTDSQGEELTCVYLAGLGETCGGWDESTGEPLSVLCEDGLMCRDAGLMSIPGAGNTCQYAQLGEVCLSWNEDTGRQFASCEEGLECRLTRSKFYPGGEHICEEPLVLPGEGEECVHNGSFGYLFPIGIPGWQTPQPSCQFGLSCEWDNATNSNRCKSFLRGFSF